MSLPHEDVDMFGRTIITSKDRRVNENNDSRRNRLNNNDYNNINENNIYQSTNDPISFPNGNEPHNEQRNQDRRYNQNRKFRQQNLTNYNSSRTNSYPNDNYPNNNPDNNYSNSNKRNFSGEYYDRRNSQRTDGRFDGDYVNPPPPPPPRNRMYDKPIHRIGPIMSFKSFMQTQDDDLAPEVFQRLYEQYNLKYLHDFSNAFFLSCITEEWFQDRYNPLHIVHMEEEVCQWSAKESASIKSSLLAYPIETINAMCLDPSEAKVVHPKKKIGFTNKDKAIEDSKVAAEVVDKATTTIAGTTTSDESIVERKVLGRHLPGHEDHCVVIYGIHANCSKQVFKSAIIDALSKNKASITTSNATTSDNEGVIVPDRIIVSQPQWSQVSGGDRFERIAWVIMPSSASIKSVQSVLNQLEITVPSPSSFESETSVSSFSFTIKASIHNVQSIFSKNNYASHYLRVQADTVKALELAYLLDIERKVPEDTRLSTILDNDIVQHALVKPTDRLDLALTYLRRVHFVSFYSGRRFRDEAHLLSYSPSIFYRSKPYIAAPTTTAAKPPPPPRKELLDEQQQQVVEADSNNNNEPSEGVAPVVTEEEEEVRNEEVKVITANESQEAVIENNSGKKRKLDDTDIEESNLEESVEAVKENIEEDDLIVIEQETEVVEDKKDHDDLESGEEVDPDVEDRQLDEDKTTHTSSSIAGTAARPPLPLVPKGFKTPNIPLHDTRIENIINDLKSKHDLTLARVQDPSIPLPKDEEDAKTITLLNENTFEKCVQEQCIRENEGKCRCCYSFCNKLFKNVEFLGKHIKLKHVDFALEDFAFNAEPYMRNKYESEDLKSRPLPPVEIESHGRKEFKSVKEILDKYAPQSPPLPTSIPHASSVTTHGFKQQQHHHQQQQHQQSKHNFQGNRDHKDRKTSNDRRFSGGSTGSNSGGGGRRNDNSMRGHDERDRRATIGGSLSTNYSGNKPTSSSNSSSNIIPAPDSYPRKITSYIDVDAPKVSEVHIDYGVVLLPPTKRRKSLPK